MKQTQKKNVTDINATLNGISCEEQNTFSHFSVLHVNTIITIKIFKATLNNQTSNVLFRIL